MLKRSRLLPFWNASTIALRFRVRNLPKEKYADHESPFVKGKKPGRTFTTEFFALANRKDLLNLSFLLNRRKLKKYTEMQEDQKFLPERHEILGPNLAITHFICARGGKIKFKGSNKWITENELNKIPNHYQSGYLVEEIDASDTDLCYEGFENMCNLIELKKLILRNCPFVDDWCLSRSYLFEKSLQYLDITGCKNVSERGICALHPLKNLKTLVLYDTPSLQNKELVSLLLQDVIPGLHISGVNFNDPLLLKRVGHFFET